MLVFTDNWYNNSYLDSIKDWNSFFRGVAIGLLWIVDKIAFVAITVWNAIWDIGEGIITFFSGNEGDNLVARLEANVPRSVTTILIGIIVGTQLYKVLRIAKQGKKPLDKRVARFLAVGYGFGSAVASWEVFNLVTSDEVQLLPNIPTIPELYGAVFSNLLTLTAAFWFAWLAYGMAKKFSISTDPRTKSVAGKVEEPVRKLLNLILKAAVALGVWTFLMMLTLLIVANGQQTILDFG